MVRDFVNDIRKLGKPGEQILSGNVGLLLKGKSSDARVSWAQRSMK